MAPIKKSRNIEKILYEKSLTDNSIINLKKEVNFMTRMQIFEPAMCCSTGLCGVGVDSELLRISTVLNTLKKHGVNVGRFNLNSAPMEFVKNDAVNDFIKDKGPDGLPVTLLDGKIILTGKYPTNAEFTEWLCLPANLLGKQDCCKGGCS